MRQARALGGAGILAILLVAAGCAGTPAKGPRDGGDIPRQHADQTTRTTAPATSDLRAPIAELALSQVGVPYRYGGSSPEQGFDCSGLVYYSYTSNGLDVPRTSRAQFAAARKIPLAQAAEGDLFFFSGDAKLSHVGIYLGDGRFVHAPSSGDVVRVASIDAPYYREHLVAVGSLLP